MPLAHPRYGDSAPLVHCTNGEGVPVITGAVLERGTYTNNLATFRAS